LGIGRERCSRAQAAVAAVDDFSLAVLLEHGGARVGRWLDSTLVCDHGWVQIDRRCGSAAGRRHAMLQVASGASDTCSRVGMMSNAPIIRTLRAGASVMIRAHFHDSLLRGRLTAGKRFRPRRNDRTAESARDYKIAGSSRIVCGALHQRAIARQQSGVLKDEIVRPGEIQEERRDHARRASGADTSVEILTN